MMSSEETLTNERVEVPISLFSSSHLVPLATQPLSQHLICNFVILKNCFAYLTPSTCKSSLTFDLVCFPLARPGPRRRRREPHQAGDLPQPRPHGIFPGTRQGSRGRRVPEGQWLEEELQGSTNGGGGRRGTSTRFGCLWVYQGND